MIKFIRKLIGICKATQKHSSRRDLISSTSKANRVDTTLGVNCVGFYTWLPPPPNKSSYEIKNELRDWMLSCSETFLEIEYTTPSYSSGRIRTSRSTLIIGNTLSLDCRGLQDQTKYYKEIEHDN